MTTVLDHEHTTLAKLIEGAALVAHGHGCELCAHLDIRRTLDGLAEQVRAAAKPPEPKPRPTPINNKPHKPHPKPPPAKPGKGGK